MLKNIKTFFFLCQTLFDAVGRVNAKSIFAVLPPLKCPKSKYDEAEWTEHVTRRATCSMVFYKNGIDVIDPTPYYLQEKTKNDTTLWHRRIWEFLEPKFPQPTQVTEVVYGDGLLYGDSKEAEDAEEPVIEGLGEDE